MKAISIKTEHVTASESTHAMERGSTNGREDSAAELPEFEALARRAIALGFTVHLTHYRFHPAHTAEYPDVCQSCVRLAIIPILDEARSRFGSPDKGYRDVNGETIALVLAEGNVLLDRYESGENLAGERVRPRRRKKPNLTVEERERRRQRMLDYWERWRGQPAETSDQAPNTGTGAEPTHA